ncbi:hypothetical protein [Novosphingobium sp. 9]|uniref:hypothetical protein n=1 Tax=Novosphingobium sp. 9 TaxID=2025349 RepID=UPI0021B4E8FC|nr:hypothetical protein [Novosphingobium sp. 9]
MKSTDWWGLALVTYAVLAVVVLPGVKGVGRRAIYIGMAALVLAFLAWHALR